MQRLGRMANAWPRLLGGGAALGAFALCWAVRDVPLAAGPLRADALSAWFGAATLAGWLLAAAGQPARPPARALAALGFVLLSYALASALGIAACFLAAGLGLATPERLTGGRWRAAIGAAAPELLAAVCLLIGYGALALGGAPRYDSDTAGAALGSFAFWFVLLAALAPIVALLRPAGAYARALAPAWLYPLARLYSLGPWNTGWSFAALLLGGALAGWCAVSALFDPSPASRAARGSAGVLAAALAGVGLGTNAGLAAACYTLLSYGLLLAGTATARHEPGTQAVPRAPDDTPGWLLSAALPFAAPFVASWMLIGASMAGGVGLLAGAMWLAALLSGLSWALWGHPAEPTGARRAAALASGALGLGAPLVVRWLIAPVVAQLQAGLAPYGDINIWPWVGLATADAANTPVTTWPSLAVALLLVVLCALVYAVARLRVGVLGDAPPPAAAAPEGLPAGLRDQVPWLALLLGPARPGRDSAE